MENNTSQASRKDILHWLNESRKAAAGLILRSESICTKLFETGDLSGFLALLIRLHEYDYRNLLLIYEQFPNATKLAAYRVWQQLLPPNITSVLKDEWKGRGIELLAPFTETHGNTHTLSWHSVKQFDIAQTNALPSSVPTPYSPYILDEKHITYLFSSMCSVLEYLFNKSLLMTHNADPALPAHMPFGLTAESVLIRGNLGLLEQLQIITEVTARLAARNALPAAQHTLFANCVCHCLFELWSLPEICPPPIPGAQIAEVPAALQQKFLDLLQRTVRLLDETTSCAYLIFRADAETDTDDDISSILGFT